MSCYKLYMSLTLFMLLQAQASELNRLAEEARLAVQARKAKVGFALTTPEKPPSKILPMKRSRGIKMVTRASTRASRVQAPVLKKPRI